MYIRGVLVVWFLHSVQSFSYSEIKEFFGDKNCILGTFLTLNQKIDKKEDATKNLATQETDFAENIMSQANDAHSAMSSINELAQYNDISYSYELINEEGPPHSKIFTITLFIGDEKYTAEEKSIKKAQQGAATIALKNTKYEHPPLKIQESTSTLTPTVLLNNLAAKLGLAVKYAVVTNDILETLEDVGNNEFDLYPKKSYLQKLNESLHSNDTIRVRKDGSDAKGPFKVRVDVNGNKFIGESHTIQSAKHEAALKALKAIRNQEENFLCLKEGDNCKANKQSIKSPISLVYESAQKRNLDVIFEIIDEVGPSHKKLFTTKCSVGNLESTGQGKSKKESKRAAAENILPQILEVPEVEGARNNMKSGTKKSKKNKKNKVIKTTFDKIDRMLDNLVDFGKGLIDKIGGKENNDNDDSKPNKNKDKKRTRSPEDEIMELGKVLQLDIQYSDFQENEKTYSLLDLGTKPSFICLAEGVNKKNSRALAAKHGIDVMYKLGLLDNLLDKSMKIRKFILKNGNAA